MEGSWEAVMTQTQPVLRVLKLDWNVFELPTKAGARSWSSDVSCPYDWAGESVSPELSSANTLVSGTMTAWPKSEHLGSAPWHPLHFPAVGYMKSHTEI